MPLLGDSWACPSVHGERHWSRYEVSAIVFLIAGLAALVAAPPGATALVATRDKGSASPYYYSRVTAGVRATSGAMVESTTEEWVAADGSGRRRVSGQSGTGDQVLQPAAMPDPTALYGVELRRLPADRSELEARLDDWAAHQPKWIGNSDIDATHEMKTFDFLEHALASPVPADDVRLVLAHILADLPGVEWVGRRADRAGRIGDAYAYTFENGARFREVLVLDPDSGRALGNEVTIVDARGSDVPMFERGVQSYAVFDQVGVVSSTTAFHRRKRLPATGSVTGRSRGRRAWSTRAEYAFGGMPTRRCVRRARRKSALRRLRRGEARARPVNPARP